jgi:hypothetical protein
VGKRRIECLGIACEFERGGYVKLYYWATNDIRFGVVRDWSGNGVRVGRKVCEQF